MTTTPHINVRTNVMNGTLHIECFKLHYHWKVCDQ